MPGKQKVEIPCERIEVKLPMGIYKELESQLTVRMAWPSRQDFIIEAVREKLQREWSVHPMSDVNKAVIKKLNASGRAGHP